MNLALTLLMFYGLIAFSGQGIVEQEGLSVEATLRIEWFNLECAAWLDTIRLSVSIDIDSHISMRLRAWKRALAQAAAIGRCLMRALLALRRMMSRGLFNVAKRLRRIVGAMRGGYCEFAIRLKSRTGRRGARKARAALSVRFGEFRLKFEWRMRVWRGKKSRRR